MPVYNLIEYRDNYSKTSGRLWQYYRDEPVLTDADVVTYFTANYASDPFSFKEEITGQTTSN